MVTQESAAIRLMLSMVVNFSTTAENRGMMNGCTPNAGGRYSQTASTTTRRSNGRTAFCPNQRSPPAERRGATASRDGATGCSVVRSHVLVSVIGPRLSVCVLEMGTDPGAGVGELLGIHHGQISAGRQRDLDQVDDPARPGGHHRYP